MKLTWTRNRRTLKHPFETAHGRRDFQETIHVALEHEGLTGIGEGCASRLYGHTLETIEATLGLIAPAIAPRNPFHLVHIVDDLLAEHDAQRAAVAAVDMALHDWIGKRLGVSTVLWLGLDPARAPRTDLTLGVDDLATIEQKAREALEFPSFKVKVGVPHELEILRTIRKVAPDRLLRVDANCGWTPADAEARMSAVCEFGVELVEQPVAAGEYAALQRLRSLGIAPIVADESCVRPTDVPRLAGVVDGVNIKLNKCGGIREARRMIHLARLHGLKVMLGCTSESSVGVAAAAQLAPLADWIDLDTHLLVTDDPFCGLGGAGGRLTIGSGPGLGVRRRA